MGILEFILLVLIAAIAGSIGQALAGFHLGGCLVSAVVGWIGAFIGMFIARELGLPEPFAIQIDGTTFPLLWSIIGGAIFSLVLGMLTRRRGRRLL